MYIAYYHLGSDFNMYISSSDMISESFFISFLVDIIDYEEFLPMQWSNGK